MPQYIITEQGFRQILSTSYKSITKLVVECTNIQENSHLSCAVRCIMTVADLLVQLTGPASHENRNNGRVRVKVVLPHDMQR